ncbi:MAG: TetR/AcrR family transcriptional regulator [Gammaproteobacteria bacterium]|nr:TetR/AcrR family transcriptional regulator [Gammaproteobacteria bacterium]
MLEVARDLFARHGYDSTSIDAVLQRSGGSKATLRKYFGGKAGLLAAVLDRHAGARVAEAELAAGEAADPEAALQAFGRRILQFYLQPDSLNVYRSVIAEGYRHAVLARGLYHGGHQRIVAALAGHLRQWTEAGRVRSHEPEADAERFLALLRSGLHERGLLGLQKEFTTAELRTHLAGTVRIFLHGIVPVDQR